MNNKRTIYVLDKLRVMVYIKDFFSRHFLIIIATLFFLWAALIGFPDSPSPWFDNGVNLGLAKTSVEDGVYSLRLAPNTFIDQRTFFISTNYPLIGWIILSFKLFGIGLWQAEMVMILFLLAFVFLGALVIRQWYGRGVVPWMLALLVTFLPFYGNGMSGGIGEVPGLVYLLLGLLLLRKETTWRMLFVGFCFGLAATTKVSYLTVLPALAVGEIVEAVREKRIPIRRWLLLAFGICVPLLIWLRTLLPQGFGFTSIRDTLLYYANPYDVHGVFFDNIRRFVTESTPIHFLILCLFALSMLILRIKQKRWQEGEIIVAVFVGCIVWSYLRTVGWYRYFFPAHLLMVLFAAPALFFLAERLFLKRRGRVIAMVVVSAMILVQGVHLVAHRTDRLYYNPIPRQFAERLDATLGEDADIMVIDTPEIWFLLQNKNTRQRMQMNPYISFGEDVFATGNLPQFIVSGEPNGNAYLSSVSEQFHATYDRIDQDGSYILFRKK